MPRLAVHSVQRRSPWLWLALLLAAACALLSTAARFGAQAHAAGCSRGDHVSGASQKSAENSDFLALAAIGVGPRARAAAAPPLEPGVPFARATWRSAALEHDGARVAVLSALRARLELGCFQVRKRIPRLNCEDPPWA